MNEKIILKKLREERHRCYDILRKHNNKIKQLKADIANGDHDPDTEDKLGYESYVAAQVAGRLSGLIFATEIIE